jgi:hypothetical protein
VKVTTITDSSGKVTRIVTRWSGCSGCLIVLAIVVAVVAPASFPPPMMQVAYFVDVALAVIAGVRWILPKVRRSAPTPRRAAPVPQPPPVPSPPSV